MMASALQAADHVPAPAPSAPTPRIRRNTKLGRILTMLAAGQSLNRFQAERFGDHCLHSTVSAIEARYGIRVDRREEAVPGYGGHKARVMRYWLEAAERNKAAVLLGART